MLWKRVELRDHQRALVAQNGRFRKILGPENHWVFALPGVSLTLEVHDVRKIVLKSKWSTHLVDNRPDLVERYFTLVSTNQFQIAMVYADGQLLKVLNPSKRMLFWRDPARVTAELVDVVHNPALPRRQLLALESMVGSR